MAIIDRIGVNASNVIFYDSTAGAHDHTSATAEYFTVIQLHRFLQDLADDAVAGVQDADSLIDITSDTPSDRSTDNIITINAPFTLDDGTVGGGDPIWEHLYDGSIIQASNGSIWDGLVVIAGEGMDLQILQNGAVEANDFWNSVPNGEAAGSHGLNRDVANGISHRFMIQVNNAGTDIDGRRIIGITREVGKTYSEFKVNGTARGNNVLALTYADDLNDTTDASGRAAIVNNTEGYALLNIDGAGGDEPYYSEWTLGGFTSKEFYERMKWITECATGGTDATPNATIYGLGGNLFRGVTHEIVIDGGTGTWNAFEAVSWTGGTGQMLAIDNTTATSATKMWIQLLTGAAPADNDVITGGTSSATNTVNITVTERTISTPFCGASTGSALIGAYGFGIAVADTGSSDLFTDLDGNTNQPPNNVTFSVGGVVSGEDRILVGPANGNALRTDQMELNATLTGGEASITFDSQTETIGTGQPSASDTPDTGTIRILGDDGVFHRVTYTGYTVAAGQLTFTGCTGAPAAALNNDAFISYVDALYNGTTSTDRFTSVYGGSDRSLFIRVRDGGTAGDLTGIKTFETTGTLGTAGGSTTAIRTSDA